MDTVGNILWVAAFLTPAITFPLVWKLAKKETITVKILIALSIAIVLSFVFLITSVGIHFRDWRL